MNRNEVEIREANISNASSPDISEQAIQQLKTKLYTDEIK